MKSSNKRDDLIQIGKVIGAHGIRGVIKVYSYTESVQCFTDQDALLLIDPNGAEHRHKLLWVKPHKNYLRLALEKVDTRTLAEALIGCKIWIPKESLPPLEEDVYYWIDLIGLAVYGPDNEHLGQITEIIETGANDVYVVKTPKGYPVKEILLPAIPSVVLEIDIPGKRMNVAIPEGLI